MTAYEVRKYELMCNRASEHDGAAGAKTAWFYGEVGEPRAKVRAEAVKAGWTHVRSPYGRASDKDYCPAHKPAALTPKTEDEAATAAERTGNGLGT